MAGAPAFAWVDIETTGLDPMWDLILEVALVVTDDELHELGDASFVVRITEDLCLSDEAREMHTANGLLDELADGIDFMEVQERLCGTLDVLGANGLPMCGSSVHFDRAFLKTHWPQFESRFHYRNIDVSTITQVANRWCRREVLPLSLPESNHRALPDVRRSISLMQSYKDLIFTAV